MRKQTKTIKEYVLLGNYGCGWEDLTSEASAREIRKRLKEYQENDSYSNGFRIVARRIPNPEYNKAVNQ